MGKHNRRFKISLVAIALFFGTFTAIAQAASSEPDREWLRTPITYSCINEPIETVLLALAEQAKVDIVKSPRVTGSVTVKLTNVPLEEALTNILAAHDFTFIATSRMIRVVPLPEIVAVREPLDTRIYQISFADANEVAAALAGFVSEQGKIALNKGTSHLVVTDVESRIKVIDEFIRQIEHPTPQILVEVQIYDITTNEGFELETNWSVGRNTPLKTTEHVNRRINTDFPTSLSETTTSSTLYGEGTTGSSFTSEERSENSLFGQATTGSSSTSENRNESSSFGQTTSGSSSTDSSRTDNSTYGEDSTSGTTSGSSRIETTDSTGQTVGNYRDADDGFGNFTTTGSSTQDRTELTDSTSSQNTTGWSTTDRLENSDTASNENTSGVTTSSRTDNSDTAFSEDTSGWTTGGRTDNSTTTTDQTTDGLAYTEEIKTTQLPVGTYYDTTTESFVTRRRKPFVGATFDAQTGGTLRFSLLNDAVDIDLALRALSKEVESKLLANPRVLVLDNETADFEIVREIPYRELMQVERAAGITYTAFKDVGVRLKVTPHIAAGGMIKLHITPEFGILVAQNAEGAPTVDTRRADTIAMVKDGQTVVIGGLRKRETVKAVSKIPLLGDLPLLGGLFKSQTESVQVNELVVFITSRIVTEPTLSDAEQSQFRTSEISTKDFSRIEAEREMTERILKSLSNK